MKLEIAGPNDNQELKEFYKSFPMEGLVNLKIDRQRDFFAPYQVLSDQFLTYTLRNPKTQHIEGLSSFVLREALLENREELVCFARDLRISQNRKAIMSWGQHALPVMDEIGQTFGCRHFFSILNMNEVKALNTFIRARDERRILPRYYLYRRFNLVSLHGRFPWSQNPLPHLRIVKASAKTWDALTYYITTRSKAKNLSTSWRAQKFFEQVEHWRGLSPNDFLVALDRDENVVGCVAPWSSAGIQDFIPMSYSLVAHNFRQFLKFGHLLGWTRTLTKPFSRLKVEAPLNFRYLVFLNADNEDIFEALLHAAYDEVQDNEFLLYLQMRSDLHLRRPTSWVSAQYPYGLYGLIFPQHSAPHYLHPSQDRQVELEPFLAT